MYKICFYVPEDYLERVKAAVFAKGAGKVGGYSNCSWQILGEGQFLPQANSAPTIGQQGKLEKVAEYRVEMICEPNYIQAVIGALKEAHPYETPAYQVLKIEDF